MTARSDILFICVHWEHSSLIPVGIKNEIRLCEAFLFAIPLQRNKMPHEEENPPQFHAAGSLGDNAEQSLKSPPLI